MSANNKRVKYDYPYRVQLITISRDGAFLLSLRVTYPSASLNMRQALSRRTLAPLFLTCVGLASASIAQSQQQQADLPSLVRRAGRAVVSIRVYDATGAQIGLGSGFIVEGGRVVTNSHVVNGAARAEVFDSEGQLLGTTQYAESLSTSVDLAVLPRTGSIPGTIPLSVYVPSVGERVIVIGAPEGLTNTVSDGIVSAFRNSEGRRWMQITAPISSGSSGGPVLNSRGEVVGVSVAMLRQGQNLNFAIPASNVRAMLASPPGRVAFPSAPASAAGTTTSHGNGEEPVRISVGQAIRGVLEPTDTRLDDGSFMDGYLFSARRGQTIEITLRSSEFDPYMQVYLSAGDQTRKIGEDDDGGGGTDSQLLITMPQDGTYFVGVSSVDPGESGRYTLSLAPRGSSEAASPPPRPSTSGSTERWVRTGETDDFTTEFDQTRIVRQGNGVFRVWVRNSYDSPETTETGAVYDRTLDQHDYDCLRRQVRTVSTILYRGTRVVYSSPPGLAPDGWTAWVPDSIGESTGQRVCEYARRRGS